jgi:ABC-type dipeptide/oligopeptide/nickel transport system permease subunit
LHRAVVSVPDGDVIFLASMSFNLLGGSLRDALDPQATPGALSKLKYKS